MSALITDFSTTNRRGFTMAFDPDGGLWSAIHRHTSQRELTCDSTETYKGVDYLFWGEFDSNDICISVDLDYGVALRNNVMESYEALSEEEKTTLHQMAIDSINRDNGSSEF